MRYSNNPFEFVFAFFRRHRLAGKLCALVCLALALAVCWRVAAVYEANTKNSPVIPVDEEQLQEEFPYLAVTQLDRETAPTQPVEVDLSQARGKYEITAGGQYRLTGKLKGTLLIDAPEENVHLFFDNVSIASVAGPAVYCKNADKLVITLLPDTENILSDTGDYRAEEDVEACLYSDCSMTINGTGELTVNGYYKDAVRSKDILKILGGGYTVKCKRTGLQGNDGILITDGKIAVSSEENGLKTKNAGPDGRGDLIISGGEFSIIAGRYAFVVNKADLLLYDCSVSERSVVDTFNVGGLIHIQEGCVQK